MFRMNLIKYYSITIFLLFLGSCSGSKITAEFIKKINGSETNNLQGLSVVIEEHESQYDPTSSNEILFNVTFNKEIDQSSFDLSDITNEGTANNITWQLISVGNGLNYSLKATGAMTEGTVIPVIEAGLVAENSGNETNSRSVSIDNSVTYDTTPVDVVIDKITSEPASSLPIEFSLSFSEPINLASFNAGDITLLGSSTVTLSELENTGDNQNFIFRILSATTGDIDVSINTMMLIDLAGNPNNASTHVDNNIIYSAGGLLVNVEKSVPETVGSCTFSSQNDLATSLPIDFKVNFSEEIDQSSFTASDVSQIGDGVVNTWVIESCGDNQNYKLSVTSVSENGSIIPTIGAGSVDRLSDNSPNVASYSTDNTVYYFLDGFIWTGNGGDDNWSTAANWLGSAVPSNGDVVVFDSHCTNCDSVIDLSFNIEELYTLDQYTGAISMAIGSGDLTVSNKMRFNGGTLNPLNRTLTLEGDTYFSNGAFIRSTSTVILQGLSFEIDPGNNEFYSVEFRHGGAGSPRAITLLNNLNVHGNLVIDTNPGAGTDLIFDYEIRAFGNVFINYWDLSFSTTGIVFTGSNIQNLSVATGQAIGDLSINKSGGTLNLPSGDVAIQGDFTYTSGNVNVPTDNNILFKFGGVNSATISPGGLEFNNVSFIGGSSSTSKGKTIVGSLSILGNLTLNTDAGAASEVISGGQINVAGNIIHTHTDIPSSTSLLILTGDQDQTITQGVGNLPGSIMVDKTLGSISQLSDINLASTGQSLVINNSTWNMNGFNLSVNNQLNIGDGVGVSESSRLITNCGIKTSGSENIDSDGIIINSTSNPSISISDATVLEGGNLEFTVNLSEGVCGSATNITYRTDDGTAKIANSDYTDNDSTLVIPAGLTSATITVVTSVDSIMEPDETLTVNIIGTDQGSLIDSQAIGTIENDDDNGYVWTGDIGDNDWNNPLNWSGGSVPPTNGSIVAMFDDTCNDVTSNCDVVLTSNINLNGLIMNNDYPGTLTQSSGNQITVSGVGWTQLGGNFLGGDSSIFLRQLQLRGGTFTSTSATLNINGSFGMNNNILLIKNGGSFIHNNGTVSFYVNQGNFNIYNDSLILNNLRLNANDTNGGGGMAESLISFNADSLFTVLGDLYVLDGRFSNGEIDLKGNYRIGCSVSGGDGSGSCSGDSDTLVKLTGNSPQVITSDMNSGRGFAIEVDTLSTVSLNSPSVSLHSLSILNGTFVASSGLTHLYGDEQFLHVTNGSFVHNNGLLDFNPRSNGGTYVSDINNTIELYDFRIRGEDKNAGGGRDDVTINLTSGDTYIVRNNLILRDGRVINGNIQLYGDYIGQCPSGSDNAGVCIGTSNTNVEFLGSSDQYVTGAGLELGGTWVINKPSGDIILQSAISLSSGGQDLNLLSGHIIQNGHNLSINDNLSMSSSTSINKGCANLTVSSSQVSSGAYDNGTVIGSSSNPNISISDASIVEGGNLNYTVSLSEGVCASSTNITFSTDDDSASLADLDYIDNDNTLIIPAGDLTGTITVSTNSDTKVESSETVNLNLINTDRGSITDSLGVGTITNDDLCPTGFIAVDGNETLKTETFCVMQFEARDNASIPESSDSGSPWVSINASSALSACESMSEAGYTGTFSLISNPEWMTIARDIENNSSNWSGGNVGSGHIPRGHSDNSPAAVLDISDSADAYSDTLNSSGDTPGSGQEQARVHTLSNNSQIWDLAGNAREWTDWDGGDSGFTVGPTDESATWQELGDANIGSLSANDYRPFNASYNSTNSFGQWYGGTNGAAIRGGGFSDDGGTSAGVFTLNLSEAQSYTSSGLGFRCVYREQQPPTAHDFTPPTLTQDTESIITLNYGDYNGDLATSCHVVSVSNVTETTPCSCDGAGVCTVGITGDLGYTGPASFSFTVTDNDGTSKEAVTSLIINP